MMELVCRFSLSNEKEIKPLTVDRTVEKYENEKFSLVNTIFSSRLQYILEETLIRVYKQCAGYEPKTPEDFKRMKRIYEQGKHSTHFQVSFDDNIIGSVDINVTAAAVRVEFTPQKIVR